MKKEQEAMKTVTILLTKYSDWFSVFLCKICRNTYSHASISIDGNEEIFYSFNYCDRTINITIIHPPEICEENRGKTGKHGGFGGLDEKLNSLQ